MSLLRPQSSRSRWLPTPQVGLSVPAGAVPTPWLPHALRVRHRPSLGSGRHKSLISGVWWLTLLEQGKPTSYISILSQMCRETVVPFSTGAESCFSGCSSGTDHLVITIYSEKSPLLIYSESCSLPLQFHPNPTCCCSLGPSSSHGNYPVSGGKFILKLGFLTCWLQWGFAKRRFGALGSVGGPG